MNPADNLLRYAMADDAATPVLVDEQSDNLMYLGYPLESCTGLTDPKWLIKRILTIKMADGTYTKVISFAGGTKRHNQAWTNRKLLEYPFTPNCKAMTEAEIINALK